MTTRIVLVALALVGCSGSVVSPLNDGGASDARDDHELGAGKDAATEAAPCELAYDAAPMNIGHANCEPITTGTKCAPACAGHSHQYRCGSDNDPPPSFDCLDVGDGDFCCVVSDCVIDGLVPCNTQFPIGWACPNVGSGPPDAAAGSYQGYGQDFDAGASLWCLK